MGKRRDVGERRKGPFTATLHARFPSLPAWEDPREREPSLHALRAKRQEYERELKLIAERHSGEIKRHVHRAEVAQLVGKLSLDDQRTASLIEDTLPIAQWYSLPERRTTLSQGLPFMLRELDQIGRHVENASVLLAPVAFELHDLIESFSPPLPASIEALDLVQLAGQLRALGKASTPPCQGKCTRR